MRQQEPERNAPECSQGRTCRSFGHVGVRLRPGNGTFVFGQVVQGPGRVLQIRAQGGAADQGLPVARTSRRCKLEFHFDICIR